MPETEVEKTIDVEELDVNLFRSKELWIPVGLRAVFGGQIIGLALKAATRTIDSKFHVHSLHCYFLLPGDHKIPIIFRVAEDRTGRSYATRSVTATQKGKTIFSMMASFTIPETSLLEFQIRMPNVPSPDDFKSTEEQMRELLDNPKAKFFHNSIRMRLQQPIPIEMKILPSKYTKPIEGSVKNKSLIWMKAKGKLSDELFLHQCVGAYLSDYELLNAALIPFGLAKPSEQRVMTLTMMSSLDHAMWFHQPFRADEWLLFELESTKSNNGRGFCNGKVFDARGRLVFSTAQEGVIRAKITEDQAKLLPKL